MNFLLMSAAKEIYFGSVSDSENGTDIRYLAVKKEGNPHNDNF